MAFAFAPGALAQTAAYTDNQITAPGRTTTTSNLRDLVDFGFNNTKGKAEWWNRTNGFTKEPVSTDQYGAKCNTRTYLSGATIESFAMTTLSTAGAAVTFTRADIGKTVDVVGAGPSGVVFETKIASVSGSNATLAAAAAKAVSSAAFAYGNDDTSAFQKALDTGQTVYAPALGGICHVSTITMATAGQRLYGDGRRKTKLFSMKPTSAAGTINVTTGIGSQGPEIEDIGLYYYNPEEGVASPSRFPVYPPAIYMQNDPFLKLAKVGIYGGSICVDARGNTGGFDIDDLEYACWQKGIWQDGATNPSYWHKLKWWGFSPNPNGCQTNCPMENGSPIRWMMSLGVTGQQAAWFSQGTDRTIALYLGSSFAFISDSLVIGGLGLETIGDGLTTISLTNVDFDSFSAVICNGNSNVTMTGGALTVGNSDYLNTNTRNIGGIFYPGCIWAFNGTIFNQFTVNGEVSTLYIEGGIVTINGSPLIEMGGFDTPFASNLGGELTIANSYLQRNASPKPIQEIITTTSTSSPNFTLSNGSLQIQAGATIASTLFPAGTAVTAACSTHCVATQNASAVGADNTMFDGVPENGIANPAYANAFVMNMRAGANTTMMGNTASRINDGVFSSLMSTAPVALSGSFRVMGNAAPGWVFGCGDGRFPEVHNGSCAAAQTNSVYLGN